MIKEIPISRNCCLTIGRWLFAVKTTREKTVSHYAKSSVKRDELSPQQDNQISKSGRATAFLSYFTLRLLNGTENNKNIK